MNYPFFYFVYKYELRNEILYLYDTFNVSMKTVAILLFFLSVFDVSFSQKDSLNIGDRYADDQVYVSVSYSQFYDQPTSITKSNFSYSLSTGFLKDLILNNGGNFSIAAGFGYGFDFFNHDLKVEEVNNKPVFSSDTSSSANLLKSHNLEFPVEIRWRTSSANNYDFWRIYTGIKFLYNVSNTFQFENSSNEILKYADISSFNKFQYGLTLSAGYDEFNINIFYGLTPIFNNSIINGEDINTKILKFGLIFYIL